MGFKSQVERDIRKVFHNSAEHADIVEFWYNGNRYKAPVILDYTGAKDRKKPSMDNADGIFLVDLVMYISFADIQIIPKKGKTVEIGDDVFNIVKVEYECGEIILNLEMLNE